MSHLLISEATNKIVKPGDVVTSFRNEKYIVDSFAVKQGPSTGRVNVYMFEDKRRETILSYYPSVFDLKIINKEDYKPS